MNRQPDVMASSAENTRRVQFYERGGELRVSIAVDRTTSVDRKATDDDLEKYARYLEPQDEPDEAPQDEAPQQPKKRGRPRKTD